VDTADTAPGCEYECPVDPPTEEVCNGVDDDCDGVADNTELLEDLRPPIDICAPPSGHTFTGTPCAGARVECQGEEGWRCVYADGVETDADGFVVVTESLCDGEDGNCDGNVDESFTDLKTSCDNGDVGACRDIGERACDPVDPTQTYCDLSVLPDAVPSSTEVCNAIDDDCDGEVDEHTEDLVLIDLSGSGGPTFYIDRYEAARPDATSTDPGLLEAYPCTKSGVLPWASSSFAEAEAACVAVGRRLCTAEELRVACESGTGLDYPYGAGYEQDTCNGLDYGSGSAVATGSLSGCVTGDGVVDLSGNVAEWSSTVTGNTGAPDNLDIIQVFGGSFLTPANGMACSFDLARITTNAVTPSLGFRCCTDGP
jgi:hypothetical protein